VQLVTLITATRESKGIISPTVGRGSVRYAVSLVKCHGCLIRSTARLGIHTGVHLCLIHAMFQPDLFAPDAKPVPVCAHIARPLDLPGLLERLTRVCERPRYSYMVLNLIAQASARTGKAGPYVHVGETLVPIRDWLCDALVPLAQRDPRRRGIAQRVRQDLASRGILPSEPEVAEKLVEEEVAKRIRHSGRTNVSRAVSELVRAGLIRRHYQGFRVDHHNRGAQRQAVYTVTEEARSALA
jgi:hypothetical protein